METNPSSTLKLTTFTVGVMYIFSFKSFIFNYYFYVLRILGKRIKNEVNIDFFTLKDTAYKRYFAHCVCHLLHFTFFFFRLQKYTFFPFQTLFIAFLAEEL